MSLDNTLKAICTVTELANQLGLSRARFYQLQKSGVFPQPIYCTRTKRPFYSLELQQECLNIRKTGIGRHGRPVIFYATKKNPSTDLQNQDYKCKEYANILRQMGLNVTPNKIRYAVKALYPEGLEQEDSENIVIRNLFRYFKRDV